ncbi:FAD-dependent oxidoreductase [Phytoactinopolyspora halotolerans]|uniref:FAD-dependent oxidoreductase n=1 Tax=Phytoactinopolyspora halotolerans TaxID=1981512 RepID=A0A6L9S4A1_9ACTN|nr:FAD-dependent oxidoreductase [Phytoactinopolyspora halotolerans]NED99327.1 FAD-dependent oxidoreductase [Phytoactinopolyspora halotolerans]
MSERDVQAAVNPDVPAAVYDVVVYGATSGGVCAAVAAAESGASVVLLEPGRHVGGMTSGGLGYTDLGDARVVQGMAGRFRRAVADYYGVAVGHYAGPEPHVAETIFTRWLEEAGVSVRFGARVDEVVTADRRIDEVVLAGGDRVRGAAFVDASYEGDVMAGADVSYTVGREDRSLYGERYAGRQELVPGRHTVPAWISPFVDDPSGHEPGPVLPQIHETELVDVGRGDRGVMSYGYRVCLTPDADRVPFTPSENYDEGYWELGRRIFDRWERDGYEVRAGQLLGLEQNLPNGKCDGNSIGPFSLSVLDGSAWRYPEADAAGRERIRLHHLQHAQDFLYFLANDPAVPANVRKEMSRWGLPADEFTDTGHLPHQLYVREARRMLGAYVLTEEDLLGTPPRQYDAIAMGSYHIDVREVQRVWRWVHEHPRPLGMVFTEGYLSVPVHPYQVAYRSLVPRYEECTNLLVPVCVSASHVAFASVRMEVQYQMLGHAAGLAAAQAVRTDRAVQSIDVTLLQDRLRDQGQILAL